MSVSKWVGGCWKVVGRGEKGEHHDLLYSPPSSLSMPHHAILVYPVLQPKCDAKKVGVVVNVLCAHDALCNQ